MQQANYQVTKREDKPSKSSPSAPFITSTLQQAASTRLGFGVKRTMSLAQRLYEAGHITYMRTDSTNLSKDAVEACRQYIGSNFGENYLPDTAKVYGAKAMRKKRMRPFVHQMLTVKRHFLMVWKLTLRSYMN